MTEQVMGTHHSHFNGDDSLTFVMPEYYVIIEAEIIVGSYLGIPVIAFSDDPDYKLSSVIQSPNGRVSVSSDNLKASDYDESLQVSKSGDLVTLTATPDPGYIFKKWYIKCGICNAAITDDLDIKTSVDTATGIATGTFTQDGNIWIQAVFEEAEPHGISIEKRFDDIVAEIDKASAKAGEKVHLTVNTATSAEEPDLNSIIIKSADTGEEISRIDGFLGHDSEWEGDITMPDKDIIIEIVSWNWVPMKISKEESGGKDFTNDVSYEVESKAYEDEEKDDVIVKPGKETAAEGGKKTSANVVSQPSAVSSYKSGASPITSVTAAPPTGDDNNTGLWMTVGVAAAAAIAGAGITVTRRRRNDD